ncbi:hypothetical protein ACMD2_16374 [Ananas comosus]|uniref:Uncharacterized protein n=1 Tax=Ananas comosus TaxID=4615 RepID=A0A199UFE1_ANACO|nr:hypothetical protein ACMD2_16374 [Ananas comosus]
MKEAMLGMCSSIYYLSARGNAMCLVNEMLMLRTDKHKDSTAEDVDVVAGRELKAHPHVALSIAFALQHPQIVNLLSHTTANCWLNSTSGMEQAQWRGINKELTIALSTSSETPFLSKDITYSMKAASQGNVIGPSHGKPNSSSDILKSSPRILLLRYANGTMNRCPSILGRAMCIVNEMLISKTTRGIAHARGIDTELRRALSTSSETRLRSKDITYSMKIASKGNTIGPRGNPNSSSDILKSSPKILLLRYAKGTMNRVPSILYTTQ